MKKRAFQEREKKVYGEDPQRERGDMGGGYDEEADVGGLEHGRPIYD